MAPPHESETRGFRDAGEEKRQLMEAEVARLERILEGVDKDMRSIPRLILLALSALPVGWLWGFGWALFAVFSTFVVMGTAAYLTLVRRNEYRYNLDLLRKELRRISSQ